MFCSKCGANVPDNATFCGVCGQPTGVPGAMAAATAGAVSIPGVVARPTVQYAGFWLRFVAFLIDVVILWFIGLIVTLPFMARSCVAIPP